MRYNCFFTVIFSLCILLNGCATGSGYSTYNPNDKPSNTYALPTGTNNVVGRIKTVQVPEKLNFSELARHYDVGAQELIDANPGIRQTYLHPGTKVTIPTEYILPPKAMQKGIVINIAEKRLYYFDTQNHTVLTFPVAVGRQGWQTPLGSTYVYRKEEAPTWHVPKSIRDAYTLRTGEEHPRTVGPGPDNPLGDYAIYLHLDGYLIHGTNNPASIGRSVSSGCIRMFNPDAAQLYQYVKRGTPVKIIYYPNKVGWQGNQLLLEAHTPGHYTQQSKAEYINVDSAIEAAIAEKHEPVAVQWNEVKKVIHKHDGIPSVIGVANG